LITSNLLVAAILVSSLFVFLHSLKPIKFFAKGAIKPKQKKKARKRRKRKARKSNGPEFGVNTHWTNPYTVRVRPLQKARKKSKKK